MTHDKKQILSFAKLLQVDGACIELRTVPTERMGFFTDLDKLAEAACSQSGKRNVYLTLNPVRRDLLPIADNKLVQAKTGLSAKDEDIVCRRWFLIDIDDESRSKDTNATREELLVSKKLCDRIIVDLKERNIEYLVLCSGNGWHILICLPDYLNDEEHKERHKLLLNWFERTYREGSYQVDTVVHNASRISRCPGTLNLKGPHTEDRSQRLARLKLPVLTPKICDLFTKYAEEIAEQKVFDLPRPSNDLRFRYQGKGDLKTLDIVALFQAKGLYRKALGVGKHSVTCPWNERHTTSHPHDTSTVIWEGDRTSWPNFFCSHSHCQHTKIKEVFYFFDSSEIDRYCREEFKPSSPKSTDKISTEWPDPRPIQHELRVVAPLPARIIPEPFRSWIVDITHRMQCPIDFVAIPAIVLTAAIIGAGCGIKPKRRDDWLVVPNLWGGVVGRPGKLKTPAIAEPLQALERLAAKAKEEFDTLQREHEADLAIYESKKGALKDELKTIAKGSGKRGNEGVKADLVALEPPMEPIWHRYKTNDATIEKMSELLAENPRGMLLFRDELIGLLATWDKEGHEPDRAFYLEAWNGYGSIDTDRIGRGTIHTKNLCVSVLGGIQPGKLLAYLYRAIRGLENDGLIQRLQLLVYPDDPSVWNLIDRSPNTDARRQAFGIIEKLSNMDFTKNGATFNEGEKLPYFRFSDNAQELFYEYLTELEREKLKSEDEPIILEHLSKYRSLMPSLALIFHLIEVAAGKASGPITLQAAELAAAWCDYLENHARRIYGLVGDLPVQAASRLAKKIREGALKDGFTARDVYRKEWGLLDKKEIVEAACEELIEADWLREGIVPPSPGQRGKTVYWINPKIRGTNG